MKKVCLSGFAIISLFSTALNASSFEEALLNGKISGEFAVTYEQREVSKELSKWNNYYSNTAYSVGSFALKYETGIWNNISLTTKVRAYTTIFEGDKNSLRYKGFGDSAERFWQTKDGLAPYNKRYVDLEELNLKYSSKYLTIIAGRQYLSSDWMEHLQDALNINATFYNTSLEAIWTKKLGRVSARDYRPLSDINGKDGAYKFGITQKLTNNISATIYDLIIPNQRDIIGGRVNLEYENIKFRAHYAVNKTNIKDEKDSNIVDLKLETFFRGFSPFIGYIKIDDKQAFTAYTTEEIVNIFEEGDKIYEKNAKTYYVGVSKNIYKVNTTLLFSDTSYDAKNSKNYNINETTLWLAYPITKSLKGNLGYTYVNTNNPNETDLHQLNTTLIYSF